MSTEKKEGKEKGPEERKPKQVSRYVPFDLLDKPRHLRFTVNSMAELEGRLGIGPAQIFTDNAGFNVVRGLIWAGLLHEEPGFNSTAGITRIGNLMQKYIDNGGSLQELAEPAVKAVVISGLFGEIQEEPDVPPKKQDASGPATLQ